METEVRGANGTWWLKAAIAGMLGGAAMAFYAMVAAPETGQPSWYPINAVASVFQGFQPTSLLYAPNESMAGLLLIMATGALWGLAYAATAVATAPRVLNTVPRGVVGGMALGLVMWLITGMVIGPLLSPELNFLPPVHYLVAHLVGGTVIGAALSGWTRRRDLTITFAPEAGVEEPTHAPTARDRTDIF